MGNSVGNFVNSFNHLKELLDMHDMVVKGLNAKDDDRNLNTYVAWDRLWKALDKV